MVPAEKRSFSALSARKTYTVAGVTLTAKCIGHLRLAATIAANPLIEQMILSAVGSAVAGKKIQHLEAVTGMSMPVLLTKLISIAPGLVKDILVAGHELRDDEVADFRAWLDELLVEDLVQMIEEVIGTTMPNGYGPFLAGLVTVMNKLKGFVPVGQAA